ncbi:MAG: hypothetical protein JXQ76_00010 [Campylobacterales bacterium]|nr:hypothetical protein [Campylobacterales bacterium]
MRKIVWMFLLFVSMVWGEKSDVNSTDNNVSETNSTATTTALDDDDLDLDDDEADTKTDESNESDDDLSLDDDDDDLSLDDEEEEEKKPVVKKPKVKKVREVVYKVDYPVVFDKETTMVFNRTKSLAIKLAQESAKVKTMVELTSSKKVRRKVCQRDNQAITCYTFSSGGKILRSVEHFDNKRPKKVTGEYKQYYTAYVGGKNCPFVVWDSEHYTFVSEDDRPICEDDFYIKYIGEYENGKKSGKWITHDNEGDVSKTKEYK